MNMYGTNLYKYLTVYSLFIKDKVYIINMAEGTAKRQNNGTLFLPLWIWDWIKVAEGEEVQFKDDTGKHGRFISIWKKGE